jgi:hypothetical protein
MEAMSGLNVQVSYQGDDSGLTDSSMVYVFLRSPGERMPLAVQYFAVSELPKAVSFSGAPVGETLELVARLSPSGKVDPSPEDIEVSQPVTSSHPPANYLAVLGAGPDAVTQTSPAEATWPPDIGKAMSAAAAPGQTLAVVIPATIAIEASNQFPADTVVFVVARRPGQKMPTAVKRLSVSDLPARIELTDADAMTANNRLSNAGTLELFARVSTSGSVMASSDDWYSDTVTLDTENLPEEIKLTLNPVSGR